MEYIQVLNDLRTSINQKHKKVLFLECLKSLKYNFGQEVSTKFLRDLCEVMAFRKKTYRISYLLKANKLKTEKRTRFFKGWDLNKGIIEIVEYKHNTKKIPYIDKCELTTEEQQQKRELQEMNNKTGINIFSRAEESLSLRQNLRDAVNIGGGVFIKDVKNQEVSSLFIRNHKEVLNFVKI